MNKEFDFLKIIKETIKNPSYLGNDCAYLDEYNLALTSDALIEDVHFSTSYMTPYEIAKKAMLVNISDIIASGAIPKYVLITLSGNLNSVFISDFYCGIREIEEKYNIKVIGGDLTYSDKIAISITALGSTKNRRKSKRNCAKKDYIVAVCGEFGSSNEGLKCLQNNIQDDYFIKCHKEPRLFLKVSEEIATKTQKEYAMMDSSDGLVDSIYQISKESNVRIEIDYNKIPKTTKNKESVLYGGEDFSLVVALDYNDFININNLVAIGKVTQENISEIYVDNKKIDYKGFKHFE